MIDEGKFEAGEDSDGDSVYRRKTKRETQTIELEDKDEIKKTTTDEDQLNIEDDMTSFFKSASFEHDSKAPLMDPGKSKGKQAMVAKPKARGAKKGEEGKSSAKELAEILPSADDLNAEKIKEAKENLGKVAKKLSDEGSKARDAMNK
eukprot:8535553-Alexandrium_andersonii.AAC.1